MFRIFDQSWSHTLPTHRPVASVLIGTPATLSVSIHPLLVNSMISRGYRNIIREDVLHGTTKRLGYSADGTGADAFTGSP